MLYDNFKKEDIREVIYFELNEKGETVVSKDKDLKFITGNIIQLQESFLLGRIKFYKDYKGGKIHENIFLPKGLSMRIESIMGWYNRRITFNPLLKYNKKLDTNLKTMKFSTNFADIHGLKFVVFKNEEVFIRKKKIDSILSK